MSDEDAFEDTNEGDSGSVTSPNPVDDGLDAELAGLEADLERVELKAIRAADAVPATARKELGEQSRFRDECVKLRSDRERLLTTVRKLRSRVQSLEQRLDRYE